MRTVGPHSICTLRLECRKRGKLKLVWLVLNKWMALAGAKLDHERNCQSRSALKIMAGPTPALVFSRILREEPSQNGLC